MADNIVGSLFGISPEQLMQQRQLRDVEQQAAIGRSAALPGSMMSPSLAPFYQQATQQGQLIGRGVGALLGSEDPELQKVTQIKQLSSQFDLTTPAGMRQFAQQLQQFAPQEAVMAAAKADEMEKSGLNLQKTRADITTAEYKQAQEEKLRKALAELPENATDAQYLQVFRQYGTPDQQARAIEARMARAAKSSGEGVAGVAGPVGKAGAYKDIYGTVFGTTEMKNIRTEFGEGQKLLDSLNKVTAQDIKDSESYMDWTTAGMTKGLASSKTLSAQTKLAASQLIEQINSLPPGSASDADMRAAMKSFPGYSDPEALRQWVNRTKEKLQSRLGEISDQFNFKQRIQSSGDINFTKGKQPVKINSQPTQGGGVIKLD